MNPNSLDLFQQDQERNTSQSGCAPGSPRTANACSKVEGEVLPIRPSNAASIPSLKISPSRKSVVAGSACAVEIIPASTKTIKKRQSTSVLVELDRERFMRRPEVQRTTGLSRSSLYRLIALKQFPPAIRLSTNTVAWLDSEVRQWISTRVAETRSVQAHPIRSKGS